MKYNIIGIDKKDDKILITAEVSLEEFCKTVDIDMNIRELRQITSGQVYPYSIIFI